MRRLSTTLNGFAAGTLARFFGRIDIALCFRAMQRHIGPEAPSS